MPAALLVCSVTADAQYFGRNKVQYDTFQFQVLETTHFRIHHYPEERAAVERTARMAERWYARLSELLDHDLRGSQPLILYASHPHFQQTNVIESMIGEGTGGVTESLRRRVVMPLASGLGETEHVLGHELVHAFQYDILGASLAMPLWFVEGMAEYLSLGGQPLIEPTDELEVNVGPVLSPDGSRLAFVSSRPRLSIDLMLADAKTGEVRRKLTETAADPHFDSLQFIQSAGTWDPTGRQIAIAARRAGRPVIAIFDADSGDRVRELPLPNVDEAVQPAWSPDGTQIAFSSLRGGLSDLYSLTPSLPPAVG